MNHFYTYAYLRKGARTPYYIGKGCGKRAYDSSHNVKVPDDKDRIIFLKQNLTEEEAFNHEKYMIAVLGRKDLGTGILRNMTDGGEGRSGSIHSPETIEKIRDKAKCRTHTPETIEKMRQSALNRKNKELKTLVENLEAL